MIEQLLNCLLYYNTKRDKVKGIRLVKILSPLEIIF